jgi:S-adenosylmethionine:tRNA-ribosyltransferase-isomerase (queuine synthetase)
MNKRDKHFVSEIDKKMIQFNATHEKSAAQQTEFNKYQVIYAKRDTVIAQPTATQDTLWD